MDRNALHKMLDIGSLPWIYLNAGLLIGFLVFFIGSWKLDERGRVIIGYIMAAILAANFIVNQIFAVATHTWDKAVHLPFHLCSFSEILAMILLVYRKQWSYEFLIYWSAGAIHSFLTPEITEGGGLYNFWEYGIAHGMVIIAAFYATFRLKMVPTKFSWLKVFGYSQLILPVIGFINWLLESNYMFLCQRPSANNPLIFGAWPYYIIGLEVVVLIHFYVFYWIHRTLVRTN